MRDVPGELLIIAFRTQADGTLSVEDIVETSRRYARRFVRRWLKDDAVTSVGVYPYGTQIAGIASARRWHKGEGWK